MTSSSFNSILEEIKGRLNIIDLIQDYLSLKRVGRNYIGLCPFHDDKNPSMHVSEERGLFHCFSCGAGGDIFGFIMKYNNINFREAVDELAKRANVKISEAKNFKKKINTKNSQLFKINSIVSDIYHKQLISDKKAMDYLKSRGINSDIAKQFNLGYAPDKWDTLIKTASAKNIDAKYLDELGLIIRKYETKPPYDRFRNRIIFPIHGIDGQVVGFGGRSLDEEQQPKYLNSPESNIFQKRNIFYGLYFSKDEIRHQKKAILVEGYMDYISLFVSGIKNVVATLGTSLTVQHARVLKRFCDEIVILYDGDSSGRSAATRAGEILIEEGLSVKIVLFPDELDPDSYVRKNGKEALNNLMENSINVAEYIIDNTFSKYRNSSVSSKESTSIIVDLLSKIKNPIEKSHFIKMSANRLGIREADLLSFLNATRKKGDISTPKIEKPRASHEKLILKILLKYPTLIEEINLEKICKYFEENKIKVIINAIVENGFHGISSLISSFEDNDYQEFISYLVFTSDELIDESTSKKILYSFITNIDIESINTRLKDISLKIQELESSKDKKVYKDLLVEYRDLLEKRKNL